MPNKIDNRTSLLGNSGPMTLDPGSRTQAGLGAAIAAGVSLLGGANPQDALRAGATGYTGAVKNLYGRRKQELDLEQRALDNQYRDSQADLAGLASQWQKEKFEATEAGKQQRHEADLALRKKQFEAKQAKPEMSTKDALKGRRMAEIAKTKLTSGAGFNQAWLMHTFKDNPEMLKKLQGTDKKAALAALDEEIAYYNTFLPSKATPAKSEGLPDFGSMTKEQLEELTK
jgi:hypothetical protein